MIGKICTDYADYQEKEVIGHGGFGKVYQINEGCAVKEEYKVFRYQNEINFIDLYFSGH